MRWADPWFEVRTARTVEDAPGVVAIGIDPPTAAATAVVLSHKGLPGRPLDSVSQLVASGRDLDAWRARVPTPADIRTVLVEDLSLDTCFAFLLFMARLEGQPLTTAEGFDEAAWVRYVSAWERGIATDPDPGTSVAFLFAAFSHAQLPAPGAPVGPGFAACVAYLQELVEAHPSDPAGRAAGTLGSERHGEAIAHLDFDLQQHRAAIRRGTMFQLLLPRSMGRRDGRRMLVDAIALEDTELAGTLPKILRQDRVASWTRSGFTLQALYRPDLTGTGNDMTISVDPATGVTLRELWEALEAAEESRWGPDRPRDRPRRLVSYLGPDSEPRPGAPDQPWYDENGHFTLVAAPREIAPGQPGSRLEWHEHVLPLLWELYFLRHVRVLVEPLPDADHAGKHIHVAAWRPDRARETGEWTDGDGLLPDAPGFIGWLGAWSETEELASVRSPAQLPRPDAMARLEVAAGYAVATRKGVTIMALHPGVDTRPLVDVARAVADAVDRYARFLDELTPRLKEWTTEILDDASKASAATRSVDEWAKQVMQARSRLFEADALLLTLPPGRDTERLAATLERMWGLRDRRSEVATLIGRLDDLMRLRIAARSARSQRIVGSILTATALGFTLGQIFEPMKQYAKVGATETFQAQLEIGTLIAYAIGIGIGLWIYWWLGVRRNP